MSKILIFPDPFLRKRCRRVKTWGSEEEKIVKGLESALSKSKNGIGLSAPQIGTDKRIFLVKKEILLPAGDHDQHQRSAEFEVFVNPRIVDVLGEEKVYPMMVDEEGNQEEFLEGCLSFPNIYGTVKRWLKIEAAWQTVEEGRLTEKKAVLEGLAAIVFQHELDHLDGILFVDRIKEEGGKLYRIDKKGKREIKDLII